MVILKLKYKYLIYSCSGCSSAAQTANEVALRLDELENIQMSCVAGIGGKVNTILKLAKNENFKKVLIDGCELSCSKNCFMNENIDYDIYCSLSRDLGIKKTKSRYVEEDVSRAFHYIQEKLLEFEVDR